MPWLRSSSRIPRRAESSPYAADITALNAHRSLRVQEWSVPCSPGGRLFGRSSPFGLEPAPALNVEWQPPPSHSQPSTPRMPMQPRVWWRDAVRPHGSPQPHLSSSSTAWGWARPCAASFRPHAAQPTTRLPRARAAGQPGRIDTNTASPGLCVAGGLPRGVVSSHSCDVESVRFMVGCRVCCAATRTLWGRTASAGALGVR